MKSKIGVLRFTDTGEIHRIIWPQEDDSELDNPTWIVGLSRPAELLKIAASEAETIAATHGINIQ